MEHSFYDIWSKFELHVLTLVCLQVTHYTITAENNRIPEFISDIFTISNVSRHLPAGSSLGDHYDLGHVSFQDLDHVGQNVMDGAEDYTRTIDGEVSS